MCEGESIYMWIMEVCDKNGDLFCGGEVVTEWISCTKAQQMAKVGTEIFF